MSPAVSILLVGSAVAISCALLGSFLVLRRMAMLGDAISHAVLPGIVIAFLLTGSRAVVPMLLGAGALGVLTVWTVERLQSTRRLDAGAAVGVVFPALFSIGVIIVSRWAGGVHLDLDCVLFGEIAFTPWDRWRWGARDLGPRALWLNGLVLVLDAAFVTALFKELKLSTFDPALAAAYGFNPARIHMFLMTMVSMTVVGAFESVGAILVVGLLVVPPCIAYLLCDRLGTLLAVAMGCGVVAVGTGYAIARSLDCSIAGAIAVSAGGLLGIALCLAPRHGLLSRLWRRRRLVSRLEADLALAHLREAEGPTAAAALETRFRWSGARVARVLKRLVRDGLARSTPSGYVAAAESDPGRSAART